MLLLGTRRLGSLALGGIAHEPVDELANDAR